MSPKELMPRSAGGLCYYCSQALRASRSTSRSSAREWRDVRLQRRYKGNIAAAGQQANPLKGFYADLLDKPLSKVQPATKTPPTPPPPEELPKTQKEETLAKARIVFGSSLAGPAERRDKIERASRNIAGVMVPPRPEEPDHCCMSGCVNCVWDMYRDELEEWAAKSNEANMKLQAQREQGSATRSITSTPDMPPHAATSMDDDGGGSETNWAPPTGSTDDLFANIPVGIRQFMQTEKMLKQKHMKVNEDGLRA